MDYFFRLQRAAITVIGILLMMLLAVGCSQSNSTPTETPIQVPEESAQVLLANGDLEEASKLWIKVLEENSENAQAHYQLGLIQAIIDLEISDDHLKEAARLDLTLLESINRIQDAIRQARVVDDSAYQLTVIGQALSSIEEWVLAQDALERAVEEDPEYAEAWAYLGEVRQHSGQDQALEALQTAISLDPESFSANLFLSIYWKRNNQPKRALPYLQIVLQQDPNNLALKEDLAQTLVEAGLVETGFETLEELTNQYPDSVEVWMMLARLSIANAVQVEKVGLPAARKAVLLDPKNAAATLLLGRAYLLTENAILAERFFNKCLQQDPQMPDPHLYLAIIYLNQEDQLPAKPHLQTALSLAEHSGNTMIAEQAKQFLQRYFP